jgi:hypothetical protein
MNENDQDRREQSWRGLTSNMRDYVRELQLLAAPYSDPIILSTRVDRGILYNGSGFLLASPSGSYLITNAHVIQKYRDIAEAYDDAIFQFGEVVFKPRIKTQDANELVDLAVIDVAGMHFKRSPGYWESAVSRGGLRAFCPTRWPLPAPTIGEPILISGWPGKYRSVEGAGELEFAAFPMVGHFVGDVTERFFTIPFERDYWISHDFDPANPVLRETTFGGISGSPVFWIRRNPPPERLELIGVVRTYGETYDVLYCTRADLIDENGDISTAM